MLATSNPGEQLRTLAWYGLGAVALYYCVASLALRWRPRRDVRVTRYEPPAGISPAAAAYLWGRGVTDKSFVVALANLIVKGQLKIERGPNDYLVSRGNASPPLHDEEEIIAETIFMGSGSSVLLSKLFLLASMARQVRNELQSAVEPELISRHFAWFIPGLYVSLLALLAAFYPEIDGLREMQNGQLILLPAGMAVWSALATLKTAPATFYKIKSQLPGRAPRTLPFVKRDRTVAVMVLATAVSLGVVAWMTSRMFALQFWVFLALNAGGMLALRAPTRAGHRVLRQLEDFRLFLVQVDSDRVNRLNAPDAPSPTADKNWPWALALDVEHAWGEQFAAEVLNRLGPVSSMPGLEDLAPAPEDERSRAELVDLRLR